MPLPRKPLTKLDTAILQVKSLVPKTNEYLDNHLDELISKYVIPEIKSIALAMNMPQGFVDGVGYEKISRDTVEIINTWGTTDKPLALWFNYGTKDHGPRFAPLLHWIDKKTGKHIYAKWVRGVPKTLAMEKGIELGMEKLKNSISQEAKDNIGKKIGVS